MVIVSFDLLYKKQSFGRFLATFRVEVAKNSS